MMNDNDIEKFLLNVPRPHVVAGSHRLDLKAKLLQTSQYERPIMKTKKWKMASAACCATLLLAALCFAAQQIYYRTFIIEHEDTETVMPDGRVLTGTKELEVETDDPEATQESATLGWQETKKAIDQGNYTLIKVDKSNPERPRYEYSVILGDGTKKKYASTPEPLPEHKTP